MNHTIQTVLDEISSILNDPSLPDADREAYATLLRWACEEWRTERRQGGAGERTS